MAKKITNKEKNTKPQVVDTVEEVKNDVVKVKEEVKEKTKEETTKNEEEVNTVKDTKQEVVAEQENINKEESEQPSFFKRFCKKLPKRKVIFHKYTWNGLNYD